MFLARRSTILSATQNAAPLLHRAGLASSFLSRNYTEHEWQKCTIAQLKKEAKARGLSQTGNKATLITKITQEDARLRSPASVRPVIESATPSQSSYVVYTAPRAHYSSNSIWGTTSTGDKFTTKRSTTFNVRLPEEQDVPEEATPIPSVPSNWGSSSSPPSNPFIPKVLTVASASTHPGGGPSHNLFSTSDAHLHELGHAPAGLPGLFAEVDTASGQVVVPEWWKKVQESISPSRWSLFADPEGYGNVKDARNKVKDAMNGVESTVKSTADDVLRIPPLADQAYWTEDKPVIGGLTPEQTTGLWVLLAIIIGGGTLGSVSKPSKPAKKEDHAHNKH